MFCITRRRCLSFEVLEARTLLAADVVFAEPVTYGAGDAPGEVHAWDVNADSILDLVVGNWGSSPNWSGDVRVLLGKGDGTFQDAQRFSPGSGWNIAAADFDTDGDLDLAVNLVSDGTRVFLNEWRCWPRWPTVRRK